ncbi:hypothetical protein DFH11DRAFT_1611039 [Phellopilus nigrolimitatus]|nr:hypothetical protein DFH11DRAFT_1611039 [Phellopilus nigrolimitatus]
MSDPDIAGGRHGPFVHLITAARRAVEIPVPTSLQVAASADIELESSGVGMSAMLGATVGSILIASWFAAALTGVVFLQAYLYFRSRPKGDSKIYSFITMYVSGLDTAHIVCVVVSLYHYLIRSFGNDDALNDAFVTLIVQSFFCWRVWKFSRAFKLVPPTIVNLISLNYGHITDDCDPPKIVLLLARLGKTHSCHLLPFDRLTRVFLGCGLGRPFPASLWKDKLTRATPAATIKAYARYATFSRGFPTEQADRIELKTFSDFISRLRWVFTAGLALGVICDVLITASLCFWLYRSRRETHRSNKTLDKIIIYTVVTMPGNLVFLAVHIIISKLFINAFLASLNARNSIRAQKEQSTQAHRVLSGLYFAPPPRTSRHDSRTEVRRNLSY